MAPGALSACTTPRAFSDVPEKPVRLCPHRPQPPEGTDGGGTKKGKQKLGNTKTPGAEPEKLLWVNWFRCYFCQKEGPSPPLRKCTQCELAHYCGKVCQRAHWKVHKPACIAAVAAKAQDAARQRLARAVRAKGGKDKVVGGKDDALCVICLGAPVDPVEVSV